MGESTDPTTIFVEAERLAAAVSLLARFDPERHNPKDYVLTIAEASQAGVRFRRRSE